MTNYDTLKEYEAHQTPVPSYEEWKASYNCMLENEVLRLKNAQLKELLKECKGLLSCLQIDDYDNNGLLVLAKIDEALI